MKSASSAFLTELYKTAGKQSRILAKIYYDDMNYFLCSTVKMKIGSDTYNPYVKEYGDFEWSIGREDSIASVNTAEITLVRNATTDQLLIPTAKNKNVYLWDWFENLTSFSDVLPIGTYVIDSISDITLSTFTIHAVSDETLFEKEIPEGIINKMDYPGMNEDYIDQCWPMVLGDMINPTGNKNRYLDTYKPNLCPTFCIDKTDYKFLAYRHASIQAQGLSVARAFKLEDRFYVSLYTAGTIIGGPSEGAVWDPVTGNYYQIIDIHPFTANTDPGNGNARLLRLLAIQEGADNNVTTWQNGCDLATDSVAVLTPSENILHLKFENVGEIGSYVPADYLGPGSRCYLKWGLTSVAINGTVSVQLYDEDGAIQSPETFSSLGFKQKTNWYWWSETKGLPNRKNFYIKITLTEGIEADIDGVCLLLCYWDNMDINPARPKNIKAKRRRTEGSVAIDYKIDIPEWKGGEIYAEVMGPVDQSGKSWDYRHPLSSLYFILVKMGDFSGSDLDLINWDAVHDDMGDTWYVAMAMIQKRKVLDWCAQLLRESGLKMWRDSNNLIRLFRMNKAAGSPAMIFSNQSADVYLMKDFKFGFAENFYNKFDLKYQYDYGKGEYQSSYLKDRVNDSELATSYADFSNAEVPYSYPEFDWVRDSSVMDLIYAELKKAYKGLPVEIDFDGGLVCILLELGDTIQSNHTAQNWDAGDKDFQILGILRNNNQFHIKAVEVLT